MSNYLNAFRINARREIDLRYKSDSEFAEKAEIDPSMLSKYLKGKLNPSLIVMERVAKELGKQLWELLKPEEASPTVHKVTPQEAVAILAEVVGLKTIPAPEVKKGLKFSVLDTNAEATKLGLRVMASSEAVRDTIYVVLEEDERKAKERDGIESKKRSDDNEGA